MTVTPIDRAVATRIVAASSLRDAVKLFNAQPLNQSTINYLVERVLRVADMLAPPPHLVAVPDEPGHSVKV